MAARDFKGRKVYRGDEIAWPASGYSKGRGLVLGTVESFEHHHGLTRGGTFTRTWARTAKAGRIVEVTYKDFILTSPGR